MNCLLRNIECRALIPLVQDCVSNPEHKEILYAFMQNPNMYVCVDSRSSCVEIVRAYLDLIRPAALTNLIRVGGELDGGYVMYPPPPLI
ncbi:hypothetical protein [Helicobacter vulpis]|uniref:hypothetical protein n=1 Tax=Helicobacter vulpis TaxID=2316076 RepID=UPI0013CDE9CF|nr:hypothetical protein [Helicobacter vulpis]